MINKFTALLLIGIFFLSCQAIQESSEKAFSNANSAIKDTVFIPNEEKKKEEKTEE